MIPVRNCGCSFAQVQGAEFRLVHPPVRVGTTGTLIPGCHCCCCCQRQVIHGILLENTWLSCVMDWI